MLPKSGFSEDVLAAFGGDPRFSVWGLSRGFVKAAYPAFLPVWADDNGYLLAGPEYDNAKLALRRFWAEAWEVLQGGVHADAVVTGNFGYHAEQEFGAAVEASGVPFMAMHKEALKTPGLEGFFTELYRGRRQPFAGRRVLVYNDIERRIQIASGIVSAERVEVCGMPRLDRSHRWRREAASARAAPRDARPRILFFSFHPKVGLPAIPRKSAAQRLGRLETLSADSEPLSWQRLCAECHEALFELALRHPEIDVVVKGKGDLFKWLARTDGPDLESRRPPNFRLQVGGDPHDLIASAHVVSGFATTALLEALAAGKHVIVPNFAEAALPAYAPYCLDLGDAVEQVASPAELQSRLLSVALRPQPLNLEIAPNVASVLDYWAGNPDGRASERVRAAVAAEIWRT